MLISFLMNESNWAMYILDYSMTQLKLLKLNVNMIMLIFIKLLVQLFNDSNKKVNFHKK